MTGLRFVAAAAVFVYHAPNWVQVPTFNPGPLGPAAVGFFFVLSGFILAHVYRRADLPLAPLRFYRARFARVWPLHLVCLVAMLTLWPASLPETTTAALQLLTHTTLLQGWTWDSDWALAWNGPAWSLSVEAFFYALFPLLVQRRTGTLVVVYGICCLMNLALYAAAEHGAATRPEQTAAWAHFASSFPLLRLQEFVLGICAHAVWRRFAAGAASGPRRRVWLVTLGEIGAVAATVACFFTWGRGQWGEPWIGAHTAPITVGALAHGPGLSWAFAAVIVFGAVGTGWLSRALATRSMVYLGEISYAVYLVHTPVMTVVSARMQHFAFLWHVPLLVGVTTTLAVAAWLHALVELPARQALLAQGIGATGRARIYQAAARAAMRSHALWALAVLAAGSIVVGAASAPNANDFARGIVRQGEPALRGVQYGDGRELLGVTLFANAGGLTCWIALAGEVSAAHSSVEARTRDGRLVHTLAVQSQTAKAPDGRATLVVTASAALPQLLGAAVLALVVRDVDGGVKVPRSGPIAADGVSLELLRLP